MGFIKNFFKELRNKENKYSIKKDLYFKNSTTKYSIGANYTLQFSVETEKKKLQINEKLKKLVNKYMTEPEKLMQYMQLNGLSVYKIPNANNILSKLGEEEGFLTPLKGFKAFILNIIVGFYVEKRFKLSFKTKEMFIFNTNSTEIYTIARALHKYHGFKNNLPGYDYESQETFKRVYAKKNSISPFSNCTIKEMYACKEAIARDLESINFSIELSVEYERSKKALKKLKETNSASI